MKTLRRPTLERPALHWPSIRGRARADAGPLLLTAGVVLIITLLVSGVPPLMRSTADRAAREAVRQAGPGAAVQVQAPFLDDRDVNGRRRDPHLATDMNELRGRAEDQLPDNLRATLRPPVTTVTTVSLVVTDGSVQRHFMLDYVQDAHGGPAVTWVAGHAPRGTVAGDAVLPDDGSKWEAQVGLSEAEAAALKLGPGDHVPVEDDLHNKYNVLVSGIFRPADANDPAWRLVPWVVQPVADLDGLGTTRLGGLLSADSLPDGRLALLPEQMQRTIWYDADPPKVTWASVQQLAATVTAIKAGSASSGVYDESLQWNSQLDGILRRLSGQVDASFAQASVLLIGILAVAGLVLLLAAELLLRRRTVALATARQRGAGLPSVAAELLIESLAVAVPAAGLGLLLALVGTGGAAVGWAVPAVLCAVIAGPAMSTLAAARATRDRRTPANRSARRWRRQLARLRRVAADVAVLLATAGAIVALRQRGIVPGQGTGLPASAPALGVVAGALVLVRLVPLGTGLALRQALRSRRALGVFGTARAAVTATRVLPLLVLTSTTALALFAITLDRTTSRGMESGAWRTTGADARLDVFSDSATPARQLATRIAAAPGVTHVATGEILSAVQAASGGTSTTPTLVVVDAAAFRQLLRSTPLPDAPDLARLGGGNPVPALVRSHDGGLYPGMTIHLSRANAAPIDLTAVGTAPEIDGIPDVIVLDASAISPFVPNTIWVTGPGAADAIGPAATGTHAVIRTGLLRERRSAPLIAGLVTLDWAAAVTLLALGVLGFALAAAASAPERWQTLARLRTLGLRAKDTRRVAATELLPPVVVAAIGGPLLALLMIRLTFGPLALRTLTGQTADPAAVIPWWIAGLEAGVLLATLAAVVVAESVLRRRRRLSDVLRVGDT